MTPLDVAAQGAMTLPVIVNWASETVAPEPCACAPLALWAAVQRTIVTSVVAPFENTAKPSPPLCAATLSATVALTDPVLRLPDIIIPLPPLLCASTRLRTAVTLPAPFGVTRIPEEPNPWPISATYVFEMEKVLFALGMRLMPLDVRFRTTQFSMVRNRPVLNTMPWEPTPAPSMTKPRR